MTSQNGPGFTSRITQESSLLLSSQVRITQDSVTFAVFPGENNQGFLLPGKPPTLPRVHLLLLLHLVT